MFLRQFRAVVKAIVAGLATTDGYAVTKAFERKIPKAGKACRAKGISYVPLATSGY